MEHSISSYSRAIWWKISRGWSLDLRSLSLFRVALASIVLADLALRSRYLVEHYSDGGVFPRSALQSIEETITTLSFHTANGNTWFAVVLFLIHGLFALSLLIGYRTRLASIIIWIMTVSLHNRDMLVNSAADDLLRMVLFWSMFLPLDRYWSWDKEKYGTNLSISLTRVFWFATFAFILQQCFLYLVTAYLKLWPEWYVTHSAVYEILSLETFHMPLSDITYQFPSLMKFLSWASMAVEFIAPVLLISPLFHTWTRYLGILLIVGLHAGIVTHISVGIFPWVSSISMIALLPSHFWEKVIPRFAPHWTVTVYFDDHCGLCSRWIQVLKNYGTLSGTIFTPLSQAKETIQKLSQTHDMWVVSRWKKNSLWYMGFVEVIKQSWLFRGYGIIGGIQPLKMLGNFAYKIISKRRKYCSLPTPIIPYRPSKWKKIIGGIVVFVSLYCVIIINISVLSCRGAWRTFFQAWPLSAISIATERKLNIFEVRGPDGHTGWAGPNMTAPRKAQSCVKPIGPQYTFVEKHSWAQKILLAHMNFTWWWTFIPRIDQYWGMFAPDPVNVDYWFVIDGELMSKKGNTVDAIHRDIWKDYAFGENSDGALSFQKYANPREITISDRWRKYTYNLIDFDNTPEIRKYFAEYWCKKYNGDSESPYWLNRFTVYGISELIKPNYQRSPVKSEVLWQHCCLKSGCFNETKQ